MEPFVGIAIFRFAFGVGHMAPYAKKRYTVGDPVYVVARNLCGVGRHPVLDPVSRRFASATLYRRKCSSFPIAVAAIIGTMGIPSYHQRGLFRSDSLLLAGCNSQPGHLQHRTPAVCGSV